MKNLIIVALLIVGMSAFAQNRKEMEKRPYRTEMEKLSPEQRNQLMLKKMTLELDLNAKQQEQVGQIIAEQSTKREAMRAERMAKKESERRPTADERFALKNKMLDEQIAMKDKMKKILSPEQFEKWNNLKEKHQDRRGDRRGDRREGCKMGN
ncbi:MULTISPECIES: Spy/CpxP family protein refolding chaperone [unclassified Flavobacterium]|jgi:hypothetical protein|uniref:Spy/CpxP family protein refolding chaperone n=1 Tax=unclassified Flavobacterium TaxID=196869 RepID=UPI0025C21B7A|nr:MULTISPECIES: hypothetical protein [unclassified Flavobacterium]